MTRAPAADALATLGAQLASAWPGLALEVVAQIDSTNTELMRRARAGEASPTLLVARRQTAGRGRLGRVWVSDGAALTFSLALPLAPSDWSGLSLAVGIAVAEALEPRILLKWPNDLWVDGGKLGGILVETAGLAGAARLAVIGVGINIEPPQPEGLATPPAGLRTLWPEASADLALARIAVPLLQAVQGFERGGFAPLVARFAARDALARQAVRLSDGLEGTALGVDERGALLVHTAAGLRAVTSALVSLRPA